MAMDEGDSGTRAMRPTANRPFLAARQLTVNHRVYQDFAHECPARGKFKKYFQNELTRGMAGR